MTERDIQNQVRVAISKVGTRCFRNNVGQAWQGELIRTSRPTLMAMNPADVLLKNARPITFGLCDGSSDLVGWTPVYVAGQNVAIFTAFEIKSAKGQPTPQQQQFLEVVQMSGGIACVCKTPEHALDQIKRFRDERR